MKTAHIIRSAFGVVLLAISFSIGISAQSGGTSIRGAVKYHSSGKALNSVWVVVSQDGVEKGRSLTDDDGIYYIGNLVEGTYEIAVLRRSREVLRQPITLSGDITHEIKIPSKR